MNLKMKIITYVPLLVASLPMTLAGLLVFFAVAAISVILLLIVLGGIAVVSIFVLLTIIVASITIMPFYTPYAIQRKYDEWRKSIK